MVRRRPVDAFGPAADRDNFRDNQDQIGSLVTCTRWRILRKTRRGEVAVWLKAAVC